MNELAHVPAVPGDAAGRRVRRRADLLLLGALLFAAFDALWLRLQQSSGGVLPYRVYLMLPCALSILALVVMARRAACPQALMQPYRKGER